MIYYNSITTSSIVIPVFTEDPPSQSFTSPGLMWYNQTVGSLKYTYNSTGVDGLYCVKSVSYTQ
jgi:hypothetical protein